MADEFETYGDRRKGKDRRRDTDRRSGRDRRSGAERRSERDRRAGWGKVDEERLQGALTAAATVAHLFSQPLTIVIGHVDLLLSRVEDQTTKKTGNNQRTIAIPEHDVTGSEKPSPLQDSGFRWPCSARHRTAKG